MPAKCCIVGCYVRAERDYIKLYRFPQIQNKTNELNELSKMRQQAWLKVINRKNMSSNNLKYTHVCAKHFISGRSAKIKDVLNPDWVPSLHLGYNIPVKVKPLARYERIMKRSEVKVEGKSRSPPCSSRLSSEDTLDAMEGSTPEKAQEICSQTEEGANEAIIKKCQELVDNKLQNKSLLEKRQSLNKGQSEEVYIKSIPPYFEEINDGGRNKITSDETQNTDNSIQNESYDPLAEVNVEALEKHYIKVYGTRQPADKRPSVDIPQNFHELRKYLKRKIQDGTKNVSTFKESINNTTQNLTSNDINLSFLKDIRDEFKKKLAVDRQINKAKLLSETRKADHFDRMQEKRLKIDLKKLVIEDRKLRLEQERLQLDKEIKLREFDTKLQIEKMRMEREAELKKYELELKYMFAAGNI